MNLELNNDQKMLLEMVKKFARNQILPEAKKRDEKGEYPIEIMRQLGKLGILGLRVPAQFGGSSGSLFDAVLVLEEIAKADASVATNLHVQLNATPIYIMKYGGEEIKQKFLARLCEGKTLFSMAQTEPDVGSDLRDLRTTARPKNNFYTVNGTKSMISQAPVADVHLVYLRFADDNSIGCLLVEDKTEGLEVGKKEEFLGLRGVSSAELVFKACRVPKENVLVKGSGSLRKMLTLFNGTRVGLSSISMGVAEAAFGEALAYSKVRMISGKPLIEYQGIQWKLADMAVKIESMKHLVYSAALDTQAEGFPSPFNSSVARIVAGKGALEITNMAMEIFGGYGYSTEYSLERYLRDARGLTFTGGTVEVLYNTIAHCLKDK
jgi:butyryl-CoA dehydrogenase